MGRGKAKRKVIDVAEPTPEQQTHGSFHRAGMAYRRIPVIETLLRRGPDKGGINQREYEVLDYYGSQASLADKSPTRSCCDFSPRGGEGPGVGIISALRETARLERDMGSLADIARAIVVDNITIEQWCSARFGSIESNGNKGSVVAMVPRDQEFNVRMATMELRMASRRIMGV